MIAWLGGEEPARYNPVPARTIEGKETRLHIRGEPLVERPGAKAGCINPYSSVVSKKI